MVTGPIADELSEANTSDELEEMTNDLLSIISPLKSIDDTCVVRRSELEHLEGALHGYK